MTNETPKRIWIVTEPHRSGKGPPYVYASASPTKGIPFVPESELQAAVEACWDIAEGKHIFRTESLHDAVQEAIDIARRAIIRIRAALEEKNDD